MHVFMAEATAPFFLFSSKRINWGKIPFHDIETDGNFDQDKFDAIFLAYKKYLREIKEIGYNTISIDELAYFINRPFYDKSLQQKISSYKKNYQLFFQLAKKLDFSIYVKTDMMFYNQAIHNYADRKGVSPTSLMVEYIEALFTEYPTVDGLIMRVGERDGIDVQGSFKSEISLKTPQDLRHFILEALPVFRRYGKKLIVRTWTVGAYPIGDLIWNKETYRKVFQGICDEHLIVSMKFGESDFFRYLDLPEAIFEREQNKIVEFQARREYEGFGSFPVFVGWEYKKYIEKISQLSQVVGIWVWPQEGGWSSMSPPQLTFVKNSSLWNELNTYTTLKLAKEQWSVEKCIEVFYSKRFPKYASSKNGSLFERFLQLSDEVMNKGYYIEEFAKKRLFFRRTRIPPLLFPWWQSGVVKPWMYELVRRYVRNKKQAVADGERALELIREMSKIAKQLKLREDMVFYYETFHILYLMRLAIFSSKDIRLVLEKEIAGYSKNYPETFFFQVRFSTNAVRQVVFAFLFVLAVRERSRYRFLDMVVLNTLVMSLLGKLFEKQIRESSPLIDGIAMPTTVIFQ